jgi:hypothetical protein
LQDRSIRKLPITGVMMAPLVTSRITPQPSSKNVLRIPDDPGIVEADDFAALRAPLPPPYCLNKILL